MKRARAKFYNSDMADLAHQLTISPRRLRVEQIRAIEGLLQIIEPSRAYPFEFVCYGITKYRKRGACAASASIPGTALISDLVVTAELISRKASLNVDELGEPHRTHQELAEDLQVSTKTIRRWRNRGLMGLRVVFEDGVNRLVFCKRTIARFVLQNKSLVNKGASFRQLTSAERSQIVERARELVEERPLKLHAVAKLIAEESGRAIETVRYTLRRYDESEGNEAIFNRDGKSALCERHLSIWRCHQAGETSASIARAFDCSTEDVDAVLCRVELIKYKEQPPEFVHNELFDAPMADALILDVEEPPAAGRSAPRIPKDLPAYLRSLYLTPLFTREQEQDLFRRYNYLKYKAAGLLDALEPDDVTPDQLGPFRALLAQVDSLKKRIIQANLRLVVSIAKKHVGWSPNFFEVVSDGNISLMRAVEKFDYARGNKFSTYATWAIMKNYARSIPESHYHFTRYVTGLDQVLDATPDHRKEPVSASDRQRVRALIEESIEQLSEREREIVTHHFGLAQPEETLTLEQLGNRLGVTKERVRQIEQRALGRLRELLAPSLVDALAG
ncbi:MAG: sigma-70 family RNA polymerase sigma factor [Phycisphaerales bacterium]|nr:MAG: sigma-70 family RNA polymerase sigma factor [Phycisphaerales bacterium]